MFPIYYVRIENHAFAMFALFMGTRNVDDHLPNIAIGMPTFIVLP